MTQQYFCVALLAVLVYHSIIKFDKEGPCPANVVLYFLDCATGVWNNPAQSCALQDSGVFPEIGPVVQNILSSVGNPTLLCILGGQLLINLKKAGERGANGGTNYVPGSISGIDFDENDAANELSTDRESSA